MESSALLAYHKQIKTVWSRVFVCLWVYAIKIGVAKKERRSRMKGRKTKPNNFFCVFKIDTHVNNNQINFKKPHYKTIQHNCTKRCLMMKLKILK
jgi:hypothetical protein